MPRPARPGPAGSSLARRSPAPPRTLPGRTAGLAADLACYTVASVADVLGPVASAALAREQPLPAALACRAADSPVARLVELFVLGVPVPARAVTAAVPRTGTAGLRELGLVTVSGEGADDEVRALVDLRPHAVAEEAGETSWWIVSDPSELATGAPLLPDHVLGLGGASLTLAATAPWPAAPGRVLDLGTGCGVQALYAARSARAVVGTDISARALAFARFAWELNAAAVGGTPLDLRQGDLLVPVAGERFDLVVSNPPFVVTPRLAGVPRYEYRDAGATGDEVMAQLLAGLGGVLAPGGVAHLLGNWEHHRGQSWQERVTTWLDGASAAGTPLDAWVVQREVQDPAEYAELWLRDGGTALSPDSDHVHRAWLADFADRGVEGVGFGWITLRPASGLRAPHRRLEELRGPLPGLEGSGGGLGRALAASLAAQAWLDGAGTDGLLAARLRVAADVTEERHHLPGEADPRVIVLRQGGGFGRTVQVGTDVAGVVGACDGSLSVGRLVGAVASLREVPAADVLAEVLPVLPGLVLDGFLSPVEDGA